MMQIVFFGGC